jgi:hypothetical protein
MDRDKLTIAYIAGHHVASNGTEQKVDTSSEAVAFWSGSLDGIAF